MLIQEIFARLRQRYAGLDLQGRITLALMAGSLFIGGSVALAAFLLARHQLTESTEALLAAEAHRERLELELRLGAALSVAESLADSTITANALADSVGRETYLDPLLRNQRLAIPGAELLLTDYRGKILAATDGARHLDFVGDRSFQRLISQELAVSELRPIADTNGSLLLVMLPVTYRLTDKVEGAIILSVPLPALLHANDPYDWRYLADARGILHAGMQPEVPVLEAKAPLQLPAPLTDLGLTQTLARDRDVALKDLTLMVRVFAVVGLALVLIVLLLSRLAARLLAAPLRELTETSEEIALTGEPHVLSFAGEASEYGRLAQAFNAMVQRVQSSYAELELRVDQRTRALADSERRLQYVMDATGEGLWDWDIRSGRVSHNHRWCTVLGLDDNFLEHAVECFYALIHPEDLAAVRSAIVACLERDEPYVHEHRMRRQDGRIIWVLDRGKVVERDDAGSAVRMVGSLMDVTDRREASEAVRVRELYLRATLDNLPFQFWLKDQDGRFLAVNRVFANSCGHADPAALSGLTDFDVRPADLAAAYVADDRAVMESRRDKAVEEAVEVGGIRRWIETYKKVVVGDDDGVLGTVGFARDISARKETEQALEASEQRWELAVSGANDGIWDWNMANGEIYFSERWKSMLGYAPDELEGRIEVWHSLLHPDDIDHVGTELQRHLSGATAHYEVQFRMRCKNGNYKWVLSRGRALFGEAGVPVRMTGSHSDITDRRAAEAALRDRTEQLDAIFALSPDGFASFDTERRVKYINPAFLRLTGLKAGALVGIDEAAFSATLADLCVPGARFSGIAALRNAAAQAGRRELLELAGAGQRVIEAGLRVSNAETVSQILYIRDVTHETEVDRMKSEFLSTAAHELRTPMASIYGFTELLLEEDFDAETRRETLQTIFEQSGLMAAIIDELLDLARIEARRGKDFVLETQTLDSLVSSAVSGFKLPPGRDAPRLDLPAVPITVQVDRKKILQVIRNVLSNAYKYSPDGGDVGIAVGRGRHADGRLLACIRVEDHGLGMTPAQAARVCERFYRAETSGKIPGTGLGMSIVKEIVELHHGRVEIASRLHTGTTISIWLPLLEA